MYNLNKEKIIILALALPLLLVSFLLLVFGDGSFAIGANSNEQSGYSSETIYERRECRDCNCRDEGKKLIAFKGPDANCEDYKNEDDRMKCYSNNSQASFACPDLVDSKEVEDCYARYRGGAYNYNQGGAGTMVTTNSYATGGSRMYMLGSDCNGEHVIKTGTDEPSSSAMTFREGSRDVQYGGNVEAGRGVNIKSSEGGAYFGSNVEYENTDLGGGNQGQGIVKYDNLNGLNLNGCLDMDMLANHNVLLTFPGENREGYGVEVAKGLEVNGDLKTDFVRFQGRALQWSEPIRGHYVLYYNTPPVAPSACTAPPLKRDTPPQSYPALDTPSSGSGGGEKK